MRAETTTELGGGDVTTDAPKLRTKQELIGALHAAAELEQQFMCQYLYAVFSLKKDCDESCQPHQLEAVRRWASVIYMIARQEMEHLSVVNSLLTAIGGTPALWHRNFPTIVSRTHESRALLSPAAVKLEPCPMPFVLEAFSLNTVRRFACMEAPHLDHVGEPERRVAENWCFRDAKGKCSCVEPRSVKTPPPPSAPFQTDRVVIGSIEELYDEVRRSLAFLCGRDGESTVFSGHPSGQSEIPSEYMLTLFPITDLATATAAIDMVTKQGEGIDAAPGFESHFLRFVLIAEEYQAMLKADAKFRPALELPDNPKPGDFDDHPIAKRAVELFQRGYVVLLTMLVGYYQTYTPSRWGQYPFLSQALEQTTFAPVMTMFVRSLAEVIVSLRLADGRRAGPCFDLGPEDLRLLRDPTDPRYSDVAFYEGSLQGLCEGLRALADQPGLTPEQRTKLEFIYQTTSRVARNVREISEQATFPKFNPWTA